MSDPTPLPVDPAELAAGRAERKRVLEEMRDIGMELMRGMRPRPEAEAADPAKEAERRQNVRWDLAAFAATARAICLILRREAEEDGVLPPRRAEPPARQPGGPWAEPPYAWTQTYFTTEQLREAKRDRARKLVLDAVEAEVEDRETRRNMAEILEKHVAHDFGFMDFSDQPMRQIVALWCDDVGIRPDWSRWIGDRWDFDQAPDDPPPLE